MIFLTYKNKQLIFSDFIFQCQVSFIDTKKIE